MPTWTEKEIEDWAEGTPEQIWACDCTRVECVGRQITLPSGKRLDLLLVALDPDHRWRLVVVEIKAGVSDAAALVQLVDYIREVRASYGPTVKVSGVLLAKDHPEEVRTLRSMMPGIELAEFAVHVEFYGVANYDAAGAMPAVDCYERATWTHERLDSVRKMVDATAQRILDQRKRALPVRYCDAPHRIYSTLSWTKPTEVARA